MSYEEAVENYDVLVKEFEDEDIPEYREFVSFKRPYEDHKLSNAFCENINGKINTYIDISRGITNFTRFRKRILFALNPKIFYALTELFILIRNK